MAARILHFGTDDCNRVIVLRTAGYSVDACPSILNLDSALRSDGDVAAVVISEAHESARRDALSLVRTSSSAPVILFEHTNYSSDEADFDFVIPNLTPVKDWLDGIAEIIAHSHTLVTESKTIRKRFSTLIRQSVAVVEECVKESDRSARIQAKSKEILNFDPEKSSSDSKYK